MKGYGKKIKYFRSQKKISQEELGERLNVTKSYISKLENEKTPLSLETLGKIAIILEVNPSDLIDDEKHKDLPDDLSDVGMEWILLGKKMKEKGITPEEIERWARIAKLYDDEE